MSRAQCTAALWGLTLGLVGCDTTAPDGPTEPATRAAAASSAATVFYTTTYLDRIGGHAYDVNNKGQVVGVRFARPVGSRPILWQNGNARDLGTLGGTHGAAYAINDAGQVIGESSTAGDAELHAFLWEKGVMHDLGTLGKPADFAHGTTGFGINADGKAVGSSYTPVLAMRAFLFEGGTLKRLTGMESLVARAYGIDGLGRIVGHLGDTTAPRAFRWQNGAFQRLGTLGGQFSAALATNDAGRVVGWAQTRSGETHAFRWINGVMTDLGTLGGTDSRANAISTTGQIVGSSTVAEFSTHAFSWKGGVMSDVSEGVARGVNDDGWIVGSKVDLLVSGTETQSAGAVASDQHAAGASSGGPGHGRQLLLRQQPQPHHRSGGGHDPGGRHGHLDLGQRADHAAQRPVHRREQLPQQPAAGRRRVDLQGHLHPAGRVPVHLQRAPHRHAGPDRGAIARYCVFRGSSAGFT